MGVLGSRACAGAGAGGGRVAARGPAGGAAARRARRREGHHRHRRHADRERLGAARRAAAGPGRDRGRHAAGGGGGDHGQDRDDRIRHLCARQDAQPAQSGAYAGRLVQWVGGRGRRGHGAARSRQPDQRVRHPAGRVLRGVRLQADPWPDPAPRRLPALEDARPRGPVRPHQRRHRAAGRAARRVRRA